MWRCAVLFACACATALAKVQTEEEIDTGERTDSGGDRDLEDSSERLGPVVTQIGRHPYAASLLENGSYICSAVLLNEHWLITLSKCFESNIVTSYVTHKSLSNYTMRVGSSYNYKEGTVVKIKMLINNFDMKISAVKLKDPVVMGPKVAPVRLPHPDDELNLGFLVSAIGWTPNGHIRLVNLPLVEAAICEYESKYLPGAYICLSGVQDPNRHFCRKDHGGAVTQNGTLIAMSSFLHTCALYTKIHSFPKISAITKWLDSVIWDEEARPSATTHKPKPETTTVKVIVNVTDSPEVIDSKQALDDPRNYLINLPFAPVNVPLEPAEDNLVIPRMSLYESYLANMSKQKTSTTTDGSVDMDERRMQWLRKYGKAVMMMPPNMF